MQSASPSAAKRRGTELAGTFHYFGNAVYAALSTQVIDNLRGFDARSLVVSNSLPVWLAMAQQAPRQWQPPRQMFPVYPSFAVPDNLQPPYASVHIPPEGTEALGMAPYINGESSHFQLAAEPGQGDVLRVEEFAGPGLHLDTVDQFSLDTNLFGMMTAPVIQDAKRTQVEMGVLAQKKTADFRV